MSFFFIDTTARAAWAAATTQQGQLEGLRDLWSGQMSVRYYSPTDAHLATVTHATPIVDSSTTPYSLRLGAYAAQTDYSVGVAAYCVLAVPAGADILRADCSLAGPGGEVTNPGGRVRLDIGTTLRVYATSTLPDDGIAAGTWQQLTFPSISRKLLTAPGQTAWDPAVAMATEAASPTSQATVPFKEFSRASMGEPGILYYHGGLHSGWPGNEIDRIDISNLSSTTVGATINHQPNQPPNGPGSGYSTSGSVYLYRQYDTGLASAADWQPYTTHNYASNAWHPEHGYFQHNVYPVPGELGANPNGEGSGFIQSSGEWPAYQVTYRDYRRFAFVQYYPTTQYEVAFLQPSGSTGLADHPLSVCDYNGARQSQLFFYTSGNGDTLVIYERVNGDWQTAVNKGVAAFSTGITDNTWPAGTSGNGAWSGWLEESKHLIFTQNGAAWGAKTTTLDKTNYVHQVYAYDADAETMTRVTLSSAIQSAADGYLTGFYNGDGVLFFAVDRAARRVYCGLVDGGLSGSFYYGPLRVWFASFDDLDTWTEVTFTTPFNVYHSNGLNKEPMYVYNGHLFFFSRNGTNGSMRLDRVLVQGGEATPQFTFSQHLFATQNYTTPAPVSGNIALGKHANYAYRPSDGRYYQMAGDLQHSFAQCTHSILIDATTYNIRTELDELTPAPSGYVRPACPDDGAWAYCGASNSNTALADKFIYMKGGDGIGLRSNIYMQAAYADDAAVTADRWVIKAALIYDPVEKRFTDSGAESWPVDQGSASYPHPATWNSSTRRNGQFDTTTNTFFQFGGYANELQLVAWNFDTQRVRIWNVGLTTIGGVTVYLDAEKFSSGATIRSDRLYFTSTDARSHSMLSVAGEHSATWLNESTGKLYVVSPGTGYLWCFETRGTETSHGDGSLAIPFSTVGERIPLDDSHQAAVLDGGFEVRNHSYLVPWKGGLLWMFDLKSGLGGVPRYAFWRRLGYTGAWAPVTLPVEWMCNCIAPKSTDIDNDEFLALRSTPYEPSGHTVQNRFFFLVR